MTYPHALSGCDHIDWDAVTQYATWTAESGADSIELPLRRAELAAQGLVPVGEAHLCWTDPDSGREMWAVGLAVN